MSLPVGGSDCILRISDGQAPPTYLLVEGARLISWKVVHEGVDVTTGTDVGWRRLLSGAGQRSIEVQLSGLYLGSEGEMRLRTAAFQGRAFDGALTLDRGESIRGQFIVSELKLESPISEEATYAAILINAGSITIN